MIGVPREVKSMEGRVGITPDGVRALREIGIKVGVEERAGVLSSFSDDNYLAAGAEIYRNAEELYRDADIIVKVKEPMPEEYRLFPLLKGKVLFTYLHLAGVEPELTRLLLRHEVIAIAYEAVTEVVDGKTVLPLLVPMSRIAGVQAARAALAHYSKKRPHELEAVILGCGVVGESSLEEFLAKNLDAVSAFDTREERVQELRIKYTKKETFSFFPLPYLEGAGGKIILKGADIVICGAKLPGGAAAPKVLTQKHFRCMKRGAYIADVAIDQGGSTAWSRVTKPGETYTRGAKFITFSCVPNIPGSTVPVEATA